MNIEQAMVTELSAVSGLSGKVFPVKAQQGTSSPYVTYQLNGTERHRTLLGHDGLVEAPYQIDIFHSSYSSLKTLASSVIAEIKTWELSTIGGSGGVYVQACALDEEICTYDDDTELYQCTIDITITYTE